MSAEDPPDDLSDFAAMFTRDQGERDARLSAPVDPATVVRMRRRRRRRRITAAIVGLVVLAVIGTYVPVTLSAPVAVATVTVDPVKITQPAPVVLTLPHVGESAVSVTGADDFGGTAGTNGILATSGGTAAVPIASISKLITALVILEAKPLGPTDAGPNITFSKADSALYDKYYVMHASISPMRAGSVMSEHDALATILVASACNYAEAVSTWAFGSQANFLAAVRRWLASHGLTGTKLVESTGIDPRNVSTPTDLIAIGKLAMANPAVASIVGAASPTVANIGVISNSNDLLGVDGIDGIKTGTLETSDLLFSASVAVGTPSPITVVGVVLGGDSHESVNAAVRSLIASIKSGFHTVALVTKGAVFGNYTTPWKDDASVVAGKSASVLTWSNTPIASRVTTKTVTTASSGSTVGSVTFVAGKATVTVPLVLKGAIKRPDAWWRLTHPLEVLQHHKEILQTRR